MHAMHKNNLPPGVLNSTLPNAGSPSSSDPSFNPSGPQGQGPQFSAGVPSNTRMGQNKPMGMMPPPSPVINAAAKDPPGLNKDIKVGAANGHPEGSPRNAPTTGQPSHGGVNPGSAGQSGTAPATPVPGTNQNLTAPSPSSILSNPSSMNQPNQSASAPDSMPPNFFGSDFMQSALDEFDPSLFRSDGDINFERDFGQWFNPDDVGALDSLK
jgi:hypothetical protein